MAVDTATEGGGSIKEIRRELLRERYSATDSRLATPSTLLKEGVDFFLTPSVAENTSPDGPYPQKRSGSTKRSSHGKRVIRVLNLQSDNEGLKREISVADVG